MPDHLAFQRRQLSGDGLLARRMGL